MYQRGKRQIKHLMILFWNLCMLSIIAHFARECQSFLEFLIEFYNNI